MTSQEIEVWALQIIDRVEKNQPIEDSRVELKADWANKDPHKTARQIAGHANAAMGDNILWLLGLDETRGAIGLDNDVESSNWHSSIKKHFQEVAPTPLKSINIPYQNKTIYAILFETNRAPYLITNPKGGKIEYEVPWRELNSIRTARRHDLLKILVPKSKLPNIEILGIRPRNVKHPKADTFSCRFNLYITPQEGNPVVFPLHKCSTHYKYNEDQNWYAGEISYSPPDNQNTGFVDYTEPTEITVSNPGKVEIVVFYQRKNVDAWNPLNLQLKIDLYAAHQEHLITLDQSIDCRSIDKYD